MDVELLEDVVEFFGLESIAFVFVELPEDLGHLLDVDVDHLGFADLYELFESNVLIFLVL